MVQKYSNGDARVKLFSILENKLFTQKSDSIDTLIVTVKENVYGHIPPDGSYRDYTYLVQTQDKNEIAEITLQTQPDPSSNNPNAENEAQRLRYYFLENLVEPDGCFDASDVIPDAIELKEAMFYVKRKEFGSDPDGAEFYAGNVQKIDEKEDISKLAEKMGTIRKSLFSALSDYMETNRSVYVTVNESVYSPEDPGSNGHFINFEIRDLKGDTLYTTINYYTSSPDYPSVSHMELNTLIEWLKSEKISRDLFDYGKLVPKSGAFPRKSFFKVRRK